MSYPDSFFQGKSSSAYKTKCRSFPLTFCVESCYRELETFRIFGKGLSLLNIEMAMINIIISMIATLSKW